MWLVLHYGHVGSSSSNGANRSDGHLADHVRLAEDGTRSQRERTQTRARVTGDSDRRVGHDPKANFKIRNCRPSRVLPPRRRDRMAALTQRPRRTACSSGTTHTLYTYEAKRVTLSTRLTDFPESKSVRQRNASAPSDALMHI
ncbi:hypothetical protein EVAR_77764_1 [Eumeta japonica]|uniref:Uncharacterized protein n=1 Tax=Eumeta variegata TaxID=151549 RepID=A0A4C1TBU6_EUMVA|nr:hypothetical protein EVAR_77764_1 [Eumeta japonica]